VLRTAPRYSATKRWRWDSTLGQWSKVSYQAGAMFAPCEHKVRNLAELVEVLDAVRHDPRAFVVRGALLAEAAEALAADPGHMIRRRKHTKNGVVPTLEEVARRWIMVDIDNWPLPAWSDLVDDPEAAIDTAIHELLPDAFHDATCWWQLSSSAGFAAGFLKVHLFFWLTEPATNLHLKAVLKEHAPGVDRAPFNAAQPHYIADPIIEGGHDPLPRRTGWRQGLDDAVELPALSPKVIRPHEPGKGSTGRAGDVMDALAYLGHGEGGQGFHEPLRTATLRYAKRCRRFNERDDDALKDELREAIRSAPCNPGGDVETPYCQDFYLNNMIEGAFALLAGDDEIQVMRPHHAAPGQSVREARDALATHVAGFVDRAVAWHLMGEAAHAEHPPEHAALVVDVGGGKSRATREALSGFITAAKGEDRSAEDRILNGQMPHRVLWLVPTHKLGNETLAEMETLGLNVAVMRGREADEPGTADPEMDRPAQKMCLNLPAVEDSMLAGYDVEGSACGSGKPGSQSCIFRDQCAYQREKKAVAKADVVIASHQSLFHHLPKEVSRGLGMVVADEAWWQSGLRPNQHTRLASFSEEPLQYPVLVKDPIPGKKGAFRYSTNAMATNDLHVLSGKLQAAFASLNDGDFVSRAAVLAAGLTADACAEAIKLEWRRRYEGAIWPGQSPASRKEGVQRAAGNLGIPRRAAIWEVVRALLAGHDTETGRLQMGARSDKEGEYQAILLHTRAEIREDITGLPVLLLDATMPLPVVRHFLPRLDVLAEVKVQAPDMEIHQVIGGWGKTSIVPNDKAAPDENRRRENLVGELADFVRLNSGGNALVVTYEAIENRFADLPGVRTGHFNAIAGLDVFRDVRSLFVIGRPFPDARHLRDDALALTGRAIQHEAGQVETRGALMADGSGAAINVRAYADLDMEAMRAAITDAEVIQAIGRGRGINRDASTPLTVFVMADVVLPLPVHRIARWADLRLDVMWRMLARGVVLLGATDAAKGYPDLFPTPEAARKAIQRAGAGGYFPDISLGSTILGECPGNRLVEVTYRPAGRGQQERRALVLPELLEAMPEWLAQVCGTPLAHYAVVQPPPPPPPSPAAENPAGPKVPPDPDQAPTQSAPDPIRVNARAARPQWHEGTGDDWRKDPPLRPSGRRSEPPRVPADADPMPASARPPPSQPDSGSPVLSPYALHTADLAWGRHVWLPDHEMPDEWWPGVAPSPVAQPVHGPPACPWR